MRKLRKMRGYRSADDLAERMKTSATSVYELERGENWISPDMLEKLCETLDYPEAAFFPGFDKKPLTPEDHLKALSEFVISVKKK